MKLKAIEVKSLSQAGEMVEYIRKRFGVVDKANNNNNNSKTIAALECIPGVSKKRAAKFQAAGTTIKKVRFFFF